VIGFVVESGQELAQRAGCLVGSSPPTSAMKSLDPTCGPPKPHPIRGAEPSWLSCGTTVTPSTPATTCRPCFSHRGTRRRASHEHNGVLPGDVVYNAVPRDNCADAERSTKHRLRRLPVSAVHPVMKKLRPARLDQIIDTYLDPVGAERTGLQPPGSVWTKAPTPTTSTGVWSPHTPS
jgi:hypothetical protein